MLEMGEWLNIPRGRALRRWRQRPSLGAVDPETRNQKPGIALIQNYLDAARMDMRGAFAVFQSYAVCKIVFISTPFPCRRNRKVDANYDKMAAA